VSVVVPTFNRRASLARLIDALAAQDYPAARVEVLVVDDGSSDGTADWVRSVTPRYPLRFIEQAHAGPGAARNRGVVEGSGELIVFLDDDVVPDSGLISAHVSRHRARGDIVVIGPMLPPENWKRPPWIRWEEQRLVAEYQKMSAGKYTATYRQFFTANASLRRSHFQAAGGFDPTFPRAEDIELGYRLDAQGLSFTFEPAARAWHYPTRSFASWRRTPYRYGQADVAMHRDNGNPSLERAFEEFNYRHPLTRRLALLCVGRAGLHKAATVALTAATLVFDAGRLERVASAALSGLYTILYWQGVSDALGDPKVVRAAAARSNASALSEPRRRPAS
jgi:GT2 family glycosyltransferase